MSPQRAALERDFVAGLELVRSLELLERLLPAPPCDAATRP